MSDISKLLSQKGLKCTRQRLEILNVLKSADAPVTAEMIFSTLGTLSLSTVYRTLEKFTSAGLVSRQVFGDGNELYYELTYMKHRHYAVCLSCRKVRYINGCPVRETHLDDFTVTGHRLELFGYCSECRAAK